ncbi:unnamed protein product, partial [Ceratitis capitata]
VAAVTALSTQHCTEFNARSTRTHYRPLSTQNTNISSIICRSNIGAGIRCRAFCCHNYNYSAIFRFTPGLIN